MLQLVKCIIQWRLETYRYWVHTKANGKCTLAKDRCKFKTKRIMDTVEPKTENQTERERDPKMVSEINVKRPKHFPIRHEFWNWKALSVKTLQFKIVSTSSGKPICAPSHLSEVSPALPLKQFHCWSDSRWSLLAQIRLWKLVPFENGVQWTWNKA